MASLYSPPHSSVDIEQEITHHLNAIQQLRARRNQRASRTQQLPPEILCRILTTYRDIHLSNIHTVPNSLIWSRQLIATIPWAAASHVCQHWRKVLLDCPTFWAVLPITNMEWTKAILTRSRSAPLKVYLCPLFDPFPGQLQSAIPWILLDLVLRERDRIDQLFIFVPDTLSSRHEEKAVIAAFLRTRFSQLRTLEFTSTRSIAESTPYLNIQYQPEKFLRRIREWLPQQLRSLTFRGLPIHQKSMKTANGSKNPQAGVSFASAEAHYLSLNTLLFDVTSKTIIDTIDTTLLTIASLLRHLEAPSSLIISIGGCFLTTYLGGQAPLVDPGTLVDPLNLWTDGYSIPGRPTFPSMMVEANSWGFSIFFSRNGKAIHGRIIHGQDTYDIRIELHDLVRDGWWYELSDSDSLLGNIDGRGAASIVFPSTLSCFKQCEHVVLSETQELQLGTRDMSVIPWVNALSSAYKDSGNSIFESRERTLRICSGHLGMTFWEHRFLSRDCSSSPKADTTQDYSTETDASQLSIINAPPENNSTPAVDTQPHPLTTYILDPHILPTTQGSSHQKLIHTLAERKESGHPLRHLSFRACSNFRQDILREYESVVDQVSWDMENYTIWERPNFEPQVWEDSTWDQEDSDSQDEYN
ncbi:hypothetical protein DL96DRAFT_1814165 [Flagelloscypha sp. PMI_526]|nr:hypothetical protein DL96DRAFT_1814165 [Flagelloscypha sp. PMI_526]